MNRQISRTKDIQRRAELIVDRMDTEITDNAFEVLNEYGKNFPRTTSDISKAIKDMNRAIIKQLNQLNK